MIYPHSVCLNCGGRYGRRPLGEATWSNGVCGICNANNVPVTEPRDFGHLVAAPLFFELSLAQGRGMQLLPSNLPPFLRALERLDQRLTEEGRGPIVAIQVRGMTFDRAPNGAFMRREDR